MGQLFLENKFELYNFASIRKYFMRDWMVPNFANKLRKNSKTIFWKPSRYFACSDGFVNLNIFHILKTVSSEVFLMLNTLGIAKFE